VNITSIVVQVQKGQVSLEEGVDAMMTSVSRLSWSFFLLRHRLLSRPYRCLSLIVRSLWYWNDGYRYFVFFAFLWGVSCTSEEFGA
jgi:hypothetical protein